MKMYDVEGTYKGRDVAVIVVDAGHDNDVKVELWHRRADFSNIPRGEPHYDKTIINFPNKDDYLKLLFNKKAATVAMRYVGRFGLKIKRVVINDG